MECKVCQLTVNQLTSYVKANKITDELAISSTLDGFCNPASPEGVWVAQVAIPKPIPETDFALTVRKTKKVDASKCVGDCNVVQSLCAAAVKGKEGLTYMLFRATAREEIKEKVCSKSCKAKGAAGAAQGAAQDESDASDEERPSAAPIPRPRSKPGAKLKKSEDDQEAAAVEAPAPRPAASTGSTGAKLPCAPEEFELGENHVSNVGSVGKVPLTAEISRSSDVVDYLIIGGQIEILEIFGQLVNSRVRGRVRVRTGREPEGWISLCHVDGTRFVSPGAPEPDSPLHVAMQQALDSRARSIEAAAAAASKALAAQAKKDPGGGSGAALLGVGAVALTALAGAAVMAKKKGLLPNLGRTKGGTVYSRVDGKDAPRCAEIGAADSSSGEDVL